MLAFYTKKAKDINLRSRINPFDGIKYNEDAKKSLAVAHQHAKDRIQILKNYKNQIGGTKKVTNTITPEHINEVTKMLKDATDFENTIAKAGSGKGSSDIRNADYSSE